MRKAGYEQYRLTFLGWLATVATSFAFLPALSEQRYVAIGALLSAAAVLVGVGLRLVRTPSIVVLGAQLLTICELLLVSFGHHLAYAVFPTRETFQGLGRQLTAGLDVAQSYAAPAPASVGLLIMVVFFIATMAALVDFLAVGLGRVPLSGLPLLALYTVPVAALEDGVPFYGFLPGAVCFVALLMADERDRLAHWGKQVTRTVSPAPSPSGMDTSGLTVTGRKISLAALTAALVVPIFVPSFSNTLFGHPLGKGQGGGMGTEVTFNDPMVSLANSLRRQDPVDMLSVTSDIQPQYLRLVALDLPGPNAWSARPLDLSTTLSLSDPLPRPTGMSTDVVTQPHNMSISLEDAFPSNSSWLPVPYLLHDVGVGDDWSYVSADQTVTAKTETAAAYLPAYDVSYSTMNPPELLLKTAGATPSEILQRYAEVPADIPAIVGETARAVTAGATDDYERAQLLQDFFRNRDEFSYDLDTGYGYGYQAMAQFLEERRGFCQHFSATMAMMARTLGIPSRVVVGFLEPERNTGDEFVFTSDNVHSWPELYFEGVGWVRFEPTQGVGAPYPQWAERTAVPTVSTLPTNVPTGPLEATEPKPTVDPKQAASPPSGDGPGDGGFTVSKGWLVPLGGLALLFLPAALRTAVRRSRMTRSLDEAAAAESAWLELRDFVRDLRLPWSGSMTPRARERSVAPLLTDDPEALGALKRLAVSVERARYARSLSPGMTPAADAKTVMGALTRRAQTGERVRALLWPASLLPDLRSGWTNLRRRPRRLGGAPTGQ